MTWGNEFIFFAIISGIILVLGIISLSLSYRQRTQPKPSFILFVLQQPASIGLLVGVMLILLLNFFAFSPSLSSPAEKIQYGTSRNIPKVTAEGYFDSLLLSTPTPDLIFKHLNATYESGQLQAEEPLVSSIAEKKTFKAFYIALQDTTDILLANYGNLAKAMIAYFEGKLSDAEDFLFLITLDSLKYYYYVKGLIASRQGEATYADSCFREEINRKGYISGAYRELGKLYFNYGRTCRLHELANNSECEVYLRSSDKRFSYLTHFDLLAYFRTLAKEKVNNIYFWGVLGALLGVLTWIFYLIKINVFNQGSWRYIVSAVLMGGIFSFLAIALYDVYEFGLNINLTGDPREDFLYSWLGIGLIEESAKIIPFLILMRFTGALREPIDYIVYASLCALGFSFVENVMYLDTLGIQVLHGRAMVAGVGHMFNSSIIAYGFVLARYKYHRQGVVFFIPLLLLAALSHGFYDYWLISDDLQAFSFLSILFFLVSVYIYAKFLNNCLNQSPFFSAEALLKPSLLGQYLFVSLVGIILFEYVGVYFLYGYEIGNAALLSSVQKGGFILFFLVFHLSNIKLIKNKWLPLFNLPIPKLRVKEPRFPQGLLWFSCVEPSGAFLKQLLPISGKIDTHITVLGDPGHFLVRTRTSFSYAGRDHNCFMIKPIEASGTLQSGAKVYFIVALAEESYLSPKTDVLSNYALLGTAEIATERDIS